MKIKVRIFEDEWYSVFSIDEDYGDPKWFANEIVEVERSLIERYDKNFEEFMAIQKILKGLMNP